MTDPLELAEKRRTTANQWAENGPKLLEAIHNAIEYCAYESPYSDGTWDKTYDAMWEAVDEAVKACAAIGGEDD